MRFINLTPHPIVLNNGQSFAPEGLARVSSEMRSLPEQSGIAMFTQEFGEVQGLPSPQADTLYIMSAIVLSAAKASGRTDCVAPATGHKDCIRNEKGHILSVPGFVY